VHHSHAVLIVADDAAFVRDLVGRWQQERIVPDFTVMSTELFRGGTEGNFDLALVGPVHKGSLAAVLDAVDVAAHPVICLFETAGQMQSVKTNHPRVLAIRWHEGWLDSAMLLAGECLKRTDLNARLRKAEQAALAHGRHASLGRYMLENRHDFNNSLTSVLGNAELLLTDLNSLPEPLRDQVETIHTTALHMYEIMQRFSSIAAEVQAGEKESQDDTPGLSHMIIGASKT
jgi:signal transduction histidine kinase